MSVTDIYSWLGSQTRPKVMILRIIDGLGVVSGGVEDCLKQAQKGVPE